MTRAALVITSIAGSDHPVLRQYASECATRGIPFIVIGDCASPAAFNLEGCDFWSIQRQSTLTYELAPQLPLRHYARKNLGYLIAIHQGCDLIFETDDDNYPYPTFYDPPTRFTECESRTETGWTNVYAHFSDKKIWPRGLPLECINQPAPASPFPAARTDAPIQQGLANENPDVDAIYRFVGELPIRFNDAPPIALGRNSWSPFNSQNTAWFADAFPLLYLPSYCSFRMTDIWRSFIAQRIAWENHWHILYKSPTVWQDRNTHSILKDFSDEVAGYLKNNQIKEILESLPLKPGKDHIPENLLACYQALCDHQILDPRELPLLNAWLNHVQ